MTTVRGVFVQDTVTYVASTFGWDAHQRVLEQLPAEHCLGFRRPLREASWQPLEDLLAYMETAKRLLAPQDPEFFWRLGFHSGRFQRESGGFAPMVANPYTAMRMARTLWRVLFDAGRVELVRQSPTQARVRIFDFPASQSHCERLRGALAGLLGSDQLPVRIDELSCISRGDSCCELQVQWGEPEPVN